ncbi:MAG: CRISPR-associated protein Cas4 [Clostridia bacterium]|nr:CRISPR-associated protein Cas4 [Clostridia bacterium]
MIPSIEKERNRITGTLLAYYFICKRKMWLHAKGLDLENITGNPDVIKGKILHETRFKRESYQNIDFDNVKIDFLKFGDQIYVHEIKKSKKFEEAHIWQLKYYIYVMQNRGVNCNTGVLHYPSSMKKVDVQLEEEDIKLIEQALQQIKIILDSPMPPERLDKKFCRKCAYFDFCFV